MNESPTGVNVLERKEPAPPSQPVVLPLPASGQSLLGRLLSRLRHGVPILLALGGVAALVVFGQLTGWSVPKFSALTGQGQVEKNDWCGEHSVPESICVECKNASMPEAKERSWCRTHGVPECPLCYPEVAQLPATPKISPDDLERAKRALEFTPRVENNSKCKLHQRRLQFASAEAIAKLGLAVTPVGRQSVTESVYAEGEVVYDPTRVARLSSRLAGTVWRANKQVGDRVERGELLALVDAAEVGRAKGEFLQALVQMELKTQTLAKLEGSPGVVAERSIQEAGAALEEARIRVTTARQALVNLGLQIEIEAVNGLPPEEVARRVHFLGLPESLTRTLDPRTASSNLLPVRSPLDGVVVVRAVSSGELVDTAKVLFVVADVRSMWLLLDVRLEDAGLLAPGQQVLFRADGGKEQAAGQISWISPAVDEKTRTVKVRVELPNAEGRLRARTFGTGQVVLREEKDAIVVPSEAVHWDGDCNVVFVRDKDFEVKDAPKVFHVRKVRRGSTVEGNTEIIAGVLPGELVATKGSGSLRSALLKNNLGAG